MPVEKRWYERDTTTPAGATTTKADAVEVKNIDPNKTVSNARDPVIAADKPKKVEIPADQAVKEGVVK